MATALVVMDESAGALDLEDIRLAVRASTPFSCSYTAWQRFGVSIPQIKVETSVPLTIQINGDPSYVPEEIQELAEDVALLLPPESAHRLRRATRRLEIRSATPESAWFVGSSSLLTADASDLDTRAADVRQVLESLADAVQGWVFDCQHGFFWSAGERIWINCSRSS
jgi:hypothetical protein